MRNGGRETQVGEKKEETGAETERKKEKRGK